MIKQSILNLNKNHLNQLNIHQEQNKGHIQNNSYLLNMDRPQNLQQKIKKISSLNQNQDICFKCKRFGQLYCCDNCFRSFHIQCISIKKIQQIKGSSHYQKFICDNCDSNKNCIKCQTNFVKNSLIYNDPPNQQNNKFFKCTHCYSKIHKKCIQIPLQQLNKQNQLNLHIQQIENLTYYICLECLKNYGIRQILKTKRISPLSTDDQLYFFVLLKTNSPVHKGWFSQTILSQYLSKVTMNQISIDSYTSKILQSDNKIQKIIQIKTSLKLNKFSYQHILNILQNTVRNQKNQIYQNQSNFQFLVKWKHNDYSSLTWQDQIVVILRCEKLIHNFIYQKKKQIFILNNITKRDVPNTKALIDQYFKIVQNYLSKELRNSQYLLPKYYKKDISQTLITKKFTQIDDQYSRQSFIQLIEYFQPLTSQYLKDFLLYLQEIYLKKAILRPTLIVTNNIQNWIANKPQYLRHIIFKGRKSNVNLIKKYDYFSFQNPPLFKFDLIFINYQHFIYQKQFIFSTIPSLFYVIFENIPLKISYFVQNYTKYKNKVQRQIFMVKNQIEYFNMQSLSQQLLKFVSVQSKKVVYHTFDFTKKNTFQRKQSKIKQIIQSKYQQSLSMFQQNRKQILIQAQRLVFLKFVLAFGLNLKNPQEIYQKLFQMQPQIMKQNHQNIQKSISKIKEYLQLFISVVSSSVKINNIPKSLQTINYYLFGIKSQVIFKRICQIKRLKNEVQKNKLDRSKFPFQKPFKFFCNGKLEKFPLWNIYQDYTLSALIILIGFGRWKQICESKQWIKYHSQLQTKRIYQYDKSNNVFSISQRIIPVIKQSNVSSQKQQSKNDKHNEMSVLNKQKSIQERVTYAEYLMNKIRKTKDSKQVQFEKLLDLGILQQHLAERAENILTSLK